MSTLKNYLILLCVLCCYASCKKEVKASNDSQPPLEKKNFVEIVAKDFKFHMPDTIDAGWNQFKFKNQGHAEHFYLFFKVPDTLTFEEYQRDIGNPFQVVLDSLNHGASKERAIGLLGELIPPYYFTSVKAMGGCGIVSPKHNADNTMLMESGKYIVECYIKEKGVFHSILGMTKAMVVSDNRTTTKEPTFNYTIDIQNGKLQVGGDLQKGSNTIKVNFNEQPEVGLGYDVHLIKLEPDTNLNEVYEWLDWMNKDGMQPKAPVILLGGAQEMPVGNSAYFTINLEPGQYAWVAENYGAQGMIEQFTID